MSSTRSAASCLCKGCVSVFHRTEKDQSCSASGSSVLVFCFTMLQTHTLFPDAERGVLLQELVHGAGHDAAQDAGDEELSHALDTNQQHNEHQGVGSALNGHQVLDIVAVVERQHMKNRVFRAGAHIALTI